MTSFKEQFPGLMSTEMRLFTRGEVEKYCLDKQRVKEIIIKIHDEDINTNGEYPACSKCGEGGDKCFKEEIFKELGL